MKEQKRLVMLYTRINGVERLQVSSDGYFPKMDNSKSSRGVAEGKATVYFPDHTLAKVVGKRRGFIENVDFYEALGLNVRGVK